MATDAENLVLLTEARDNIITRIVEVTSNPKPNYEIDGQKVKWADYLKTLQESLKKQNELIQQMDDLFEVHSNWYT